MKWNGICGTMDNMHVLRCRISVFASEVLKAIQFSTTPGIRYTAGAVYRL